MPDETFKGLTSAQYNVFAQITINKQPYAARSTIEALLKKGLIVKIAPRAVFGKGTSIFDRMPVLVEQYAIPISVHLEWCAWCAEHPDEEGDSNASN